MAAEGEFAFVIAAFAVESKLIDQKLYSSIVLAILLSTIIAPFSLKFTINHFNKKALQQAEEEDGSMVNPGDVEAIRNAANTVFFCVNMTSRVTWGTLPKLMQTLFDLHLEVIDHRSWHTRFEDTVVNEVYVKGELKDGDDIGDLVLSIFDKISEAIGQPVSIYRWMDG